MGELGPEELLRYDRQMLLPDFGRAGQERLRASSVLLIGAGGLGSPLALYLAAAGVGRIGLVEDDRIDASNLQRQILYASDQTGESKAQHAARRMQALNPHVSIQVFEERLTSANALGLVSRYDVVADGSDNFPTRYLVNDACVLANRPLVYGAILRYEGQVTVFHHDGGPCYRCLFPEPPPPGAAPSCTEAGVLGVLPGVIGCLQATEALKLLAGIGTGLSGRLLLYDAHALRFREIQLKRNPDCAVCGDAPTVSRLIDYDAFCGLRPRRGNPAGGLEPGDAEVSPGELQGMLREASDPLQLIDLREPAERAIYALPGSVAIPLGELEARKGELRRDQKIILYCKSGQRSARGLRVLREAGFPVVLHLAGGVDAWLRRESQARSAEERSGEAAHSP